jgi:hypothetical protein
MAMVVALFLAVLPELNAQVASFSSASQLVPRADSSPTFLVADASGKAAPSVPGDQPGVFEINVEHGRLTSKRRVLVVHRNDEVILHITTDTPDEFHLHGYNLLVELAPGKAATLHFRANLTGRFTYELHKTDLELGALEVYP